MTRETGRTTIPSDYTGGFLALDEAGEAISAFETWGEAWDAAHAKRGSVLLLNGRRIDASRIAMVRIESFYSDGHESLTEIPLPAPLGELEEWWEDVVFPHTGDGHGQNSSLGSYYAATIISADERRLVGETCEWY